MTPPPSSYEPQALLANAGWVRRLARKLVDDVHQADDLVQDALVVAMERRAGGERPTASWFAGVLRNLAFKSRRGTVRRARRERDSARSESLPGAGELFERVSLHRTVVDAVMALDDPYRTAILMRFIDELPPRVIARELDLPVNTVRTHLARGLDLLRARLDRDAGGREKWLPGLLAMCELPKTLAGPTLGALTVSAKLKIAMVGTLSVLGLYAGVRFLEERPVQDAEPGDLAESSYEVVAPAYEDEGERDVEPVAGERVVVAPPVDEEPAAETRAPAQGSLAVVVRAKESGRALAGARLFVRPRGERPADDQRVVLSSKGSLEIAPVTDVDGRAELVLPSGVPLTVLVRGPWAAAGNGEWEVDALVAGEEREIVFELATAADTRFFGRVVSVVDNSPVADAAVRIDDVPTWTASGGNAERGEALTSTFTRPDGTFDLWFPSWKPVVATVVAEAYGTRMVVVTDAHEAPDRPIVVRLEEEARLELTVRRSDGAPFEGAQARLATGSFRMLEDQGNLVWKPDPNWRAEAQADGLCVLANLPARVDLALSLEGDGTTRHEPEPIKLAPGEVRKLEVSLGDGFSLYGTVVDEDLRPLANQPVWMMNAMARGPHFFQSFEEVHGKTKTDDEGRFAFEDLAAGHYWVGPAPGGRGRAEDAVAPFAEFVALSDEAPRQQVELVVQRGIYIRGAAVGGDGAPVPHAYVFGVLEGGIASTTSRTAADGSFVLGPLVEGRYMLRGQSFGGGSHTDAPPVAALAGEEDVQLTFAVGGTIRGRITVRETGEEVGYDILFQPADGRGFPAALSSLEKKATTYERAGLKPGTYNVVARTRGGMTAVAAGVEVVAGQETNGVDLLVEPGAELRLSIECELPFAQVSIWQGEVFLGRGNFAGGSDWNQVLPAGEITVKASPPPDVPTPKPITKTVTLRAGEAHELEVRL